MTKIIAVTGATGAQGGAVVRVMLKTPGWEVRAITRNPDSDAAKAIAAQGATVVVANYDDESSLVKAFEGVHAIFAVTNFWEHLFFRGKTPDQAGEAEQEQALLLAGAAAKTSTLEHYIWATLPPASSLTGGKHPVPHLDYKAKADDRIRKELPDLAKKTTYLFCGYYPSNMAFFPMVKPFELPGSFGKYVQLLPTTTSSTIPTSGDMTVTPGLWVRQILANPQKTLGKYADICTEILSFGEMMDIWSSITGKSGVFVECSSEDFEKMWGVAGRELSQQLKFGEAVTDWHAGLPAPFVTMEELGITEDVGFKKALEGLKDSLL